MKVIRTDVSRSTAMALLDEEFKSTSEHHHIASVSLTIAKVGAGVHIRVEVNVLKLYTKQWGVVGILGTDGKVIRPAVMASTFSGPNLPEDPEGFLKVVDDIVAHILAAQEVRDVEKNPWKP